MSRTERIVRSAGCAILSLAVALTVAAQASKPAVKVTASSPVVDRIRSTGTVHFGYRNDASPFAFKDPSGNPAGFSVEVCQKVAEGLKTELNLTNLKVEWVPLTLEERLSAIETGKVDLLCGAETVSLTKRETMTFSIPIFPSGIGALMRADAPPRLVEILNGQPQTSPVWRAQAGQLINVQTFAVVNGTTAVPWIATKLTTLNLTAKVSTVSSYADGVQQVLDGKTNVLFGDRAILLDAVVHNDKGKDLQVAGRFFTYESLAFPMARGDAQFLLAVDRALSRLFWTTDFRATYMKWFGKPNVSVLNFYRWNALPE